MTGTTKYMLNVGKELFFVPAKMILKCLTSRSDADIYAKLIQGTWQLRGIFLTLQFDEHQSCSHNASNRFITLTIESIWFTSTYVVVVTLHIKVWLEMKYFNWSLISHLLIFVGTDPEDHSLLSRLHSQFAGRAQEEGLYSSE